MWFKKNNNPETPAEEPVEAAAVQSPETQMPPLTEELPAEEPVAEVAQAEEAEVEVQAEEAEAEVETVEAEAVEAETEEVEAAEVEVVPEIIEAQIEEVEVDETESVEVREEPEPADPELAVLLQDTVVLPDAESFDLDEILKEFAPEESAEAPAPQEPVTADTVRLDMPDFHIRSVEEIQDTIRLQMPVTEDAVRLQTPVTGDTVRLNAEEKPQAAPPSEQLGDTVRFTPVTEEKAAEATGTEPFSEGWEPEYEQPMGEYVPPQPIQFQPKSRLRELKRKLVAGPERRYYEISEQGFVKLQFAIIVSFLVAALSTAATVLSLPEVDILGTRFDKLVAFSQIFGMLIAALMGIYQLMDGIADIFRKRFSLNTLLVFSFIACVADGVFCLQSQTPRVPCSAAFSLQMTMSLWNAYHVRSTEMGQMDTMRKAARLDSLVESPDYHDGCTGILRGEGQVEDFMDHYQERSTKDRVTSIYAFLALLFSIGCGVTAYLMHGSVSFAVQATSVSLLAAVPGTFFISFSRPMAILEKRLHRLGAVLCGWKRITKLSRRVVFPLSHSDLFPNGACMLNGVKYYGTRDPDQVVAYATGIVAADGGGLAPLFEQLLASRNGQHYKVENLRHYGGGGIGGEVGGEPVLVGVSEFLKTMGVEIPEGTMVANAVYVAIDGELSGVFAISCSRSKSTASGLNTLCGYRGLRPVLVTADFMLTEEFIRGKFGVNTRRISFPEYETRDELAAKGPEPDAPALALVTRDGLAPLAYAVTGARSVRTACRIGLFIHLLGGILGLGIMLTLTILNAGSLMTPVNMLLYQLIWMIPGLLVTEWTRAI